VVQPRIVVVGPGQHHDADAVLPLELFEHLAGALLDVALELLQLLEADVDRPDVLFL
jgi:hypothetical protein